MERVVPGNPIDTRQLCWCLVSDGYLENLKGLKTPRNNLQETPGIKICGMQEGWLVTVKAAVDSLARSPCHLLAKILGTGCPAPHPRHVVQASR